MEPLGRAHYRQAIHATTELALQTDKGIVLAVSVLDKLRHRQDGLAGLAAAIARQAEPRDRLEHIERFKAWQALGLPTGIGRSAINSRAFAVK